MRGILLHPSTLLVALTLLLGMSAGWQVSAGAGDPGSPPSGEHEADKPAAPRRVILRVNRNVEVVGRVELEDEEVIVVRTPQDTIESYLKTRVLEIVRLVDPEPGQRGAVVMKSGHRRDGVIIEDTFDHVVIEIEGIRTRLSREHVDYVILEPTFEEQYRQLKASIGPGMHDRHLMLCRWLIEHRRYELARENLLELLDDVDPRRAPEARRMLNVVEAQLELIRASKEADGADAADAETDTESMGQGESRTFDAGRILTRNEVNLIRVYEIDFDHPPKLLVPQDTVRTLINEYSTSPLMPTDPGDRGALLSADPVHLVRLMFELRARELYPQVRVLSEPHAMNLFRQRVHNTWLLNNCATSGCHGGPDAGRLFLHRDGYKDERVRYTNFLILERLEVDPQWPLINYDEPEMSLILQYGLPRDAARLAHPDVPGWRPIFGPTNERVRQDAIAWIRAMMTPRPVYPIDYVPPDPTAGAEDSAKDTGETEAPADSPVPAAIDSPS